MCGMSAVRGDYVKGMHLRRSLVVGTTQMAPAAGTALRRDGGSASANLCPFLLRNHQHCHFPVYNLLPGNFNFHPIHVQ